MAIHVKWENNFPLDKKRCILSNIKQSAAALLVSEGTGAKMVPMALIALSLFSDSNQGHEEKPWLRTDASPG